MFHLCGIDDDGINLNVKASYTWQWPTLKSKILWSLRTFYLSLFIDTCPLFVHFWWSKDKRRGIAKLLSRFSQKRLPLDSRKKIHTSLHTLTLHTANEMNILVVHSTTRCQFVDSRRSRTQRKYSSREAIWRDRTFLWFLLVFPSYLNRACIACLLARSQVT